MAGVGHELAHPRLRGLGLPGGLPGCLLGGLLRGQRAGEVVDHRVERVGEAADLRARVGCRRASIEVPGGDGRGGLLHLRQGAQAAADEDPPGDAEHEQHQGADCQLDEDEPVDRRVDATDVLGHGHGAGAIRQRHGDARHRPAPDWESTT